MNYSWGKNTQWGDYPHIYIGLQNVEARGRKFFDDFENLKKFKKVLAF